MFFVPQVLKSIYGQTRRPDAVVLHLSEEEYPQMEDGLPTDVLRYVRREGLLLRWHKGNARQWKKLIPTMREWPEAEIVSLDDDIIYPADFIERLTDEFRADGRTHPVTCGHSVWTGYGRIKSHYGCFTVTMAKFHAPEVFELWERDIRPIVIAARRKTFDDPLYTHTALMHGVLYKGSAMNLNPLRKVHRLPEPVSHNANWRTDWFGWNDFLHDLIRKRYGIDTQQRAKELMAPCP
mgnify:CR=1 FL=1